MDFLPDGCFSCSFALNDFRFLFTSIHILYQYFTHSKILFSFLYLFSLPYDRINLIFFFFVFHFLFVALHPRFGLSKNNTIDCGFSMGHTKKVLIMITFLLLSFLFTCLTSFFSLFRRWHPPSTYPGFMVVSTLSFHFLFSFVISLLPFIYSFFSLLGTLCIFFMIDRAAFELLRFIARRSWKICSMFPVN